MAILQQPKPTANGEYLCVSEHIDSTNINCSHVKRTTTPAADTSMTRGTPHRAGEHRCNWTRPRQRLVSPDGTVLNNVLTPHSSSPTRRTKAHISWHSQQAAYHCARCLLRPCQGDSKRPNNPSPPKLSYCHSSK